MKHKVPVAFGIGFVAALALTKGVQHCRQMMSQMRSVAELPACCSKPATEACSPAGGMPVVTPAAA